MTMLIMFNNYLEYLVLYNAPGYVSYEKQQFKFFEMYYDGFGSMDSSFFTKDKILALMSDLKKKGLSFNTINKHVSFLKRIYKFNNVECPFQSIKKLHEKFVTFGTTKEDPLDVFKQLEGVVSLQSLTILYLFYDTGIRLNELLNIEVRNVFLEKRCIFLTTTKTNKDRYVYFSNHTKKLVAKHLNLSGNKGYLFTNKDGGKLKYFKETNTFLKTNIKDGLLYGNRNSLIVYKNNKLYLYDENMNNFIIMYSDTILMKIMKIFNVFVVIMLTFYFILSFVETSERYNRYFLSSKK